MTAANLAALPPNGTGGQPQLRLIRPGRSERPKPVIPVIGLAAMLDSEAVERLAGGGHDGPAHLGRLTDALNAVRAAPQVSAPQAMSPVARLAMRYADPARGGPQSVREVLYALHGCLRPVSSESRLTIALNPHSIGQSLRHGEALSCVLHTLALEAVAYFAGRVLIEAYAQADSALTLMVRGMPSRRPGSQGAEAHTTESAAQVNRSWESSGCGLAMHTCQRVVRALGSELMQQCLPTGERRYWFAVTFPQAAMG